MTTAGGRISACFTDHPFEPHRWLKSGHLQTIVGSQQRRRFDWGWKKSTPVTADLRDGTRIEAQWIQVDASAPTLIAVHGMAGSFHSAYMLGLSHKAFRIGWNSLLLNLYDRRLDQQRPTLFHAGSNAAVWAGILEFRRMLGFGMAVPVGVSLGGNIVLKLMGELGSNLPDWVAGGAVISPLADLTESWQLLEQPTNWIYQVYYIARLKRLARELVLSIPAGLTKAVKGSARPLVDPQELSGIRTVRRFDEVITAPLGGFSDVFEYYRTASAAPYISSIPRPTLIIHALDDPFLPVTPLMRARQNPNIHLELTRQGGHVAFIENRKRDWDRSWAENRVIDFLAILAGKGEDNR